MKQGWIITGAVASGILGITIYFIAKALEEGWL